MAGNLPTWDETAPAQPKPEGVLPTWEETTEVAAPQETGVLEDAVDTAKAFGSGVERGMTFGFSEKLRAFGTSISPLQLLPGFESLTYDEALAAERARSEEISAKAPVAGFLGDVAGGVLSGGSTVKGLAATAKVGAGLGALEAAGRTEDLLTTEGLIDVAQGAGIGAAVPVALHGAGAAIKKAGSAVNKGVRKSVEETPEALKVLTGADTRVTKGIIKDPVAFESSKTLEKISDELQEGMETLQDQARHYDDAASRHLSSKAEVDVDDIENSFTKLLRSRGVLRQNKTTGALEASGLSDAKSSIDTIRTIQDELTSFGSSEADVKGVIKKLDAMSGWKSDTPDATKKIIRLARRELDQRLKKGNPEYAKAMKPSAEKHALLDEMQKHFKFEKGKMSDISHSKLKSLRNETIKGGKPGTKSLIDRFNPNMLKDLEYSRLGEIAETSTAQGSRRVLTGENVGGTIGGVIGGTVGGFPGAYIGEKVGRGVGAVSGYMVDSKGQKWTSQVVKKLASDKPRWAAFLNEVGFTGSEKAANMLRKAAVTGGLRRMILIGKHMDQKAEKDSKKSPK